LSEGFVLIEMIGCLNADLIRQISSKKKEPDWMFELRIKALKHYMQRPVPTWGADLSQLKEEEIQFYAPPETQKHHSWDDVPNDIKKVYDNLKIPEAERRFLAGVEAQFDSSVVYGRIKERWESLGVIFTDTDTAVQQYPEILRKYFGKVVPYTDNKYAALNTACWSGGSFVYVPKGVKLDIPLQAYFYVKTSNLGQFERTLIIADEGAEVSYIEGCSAPVYKTSILHSGVIELVAHKNAKIRYTTIQNWSKNVYNLVTQRGIAYEGARIEWIDCNIGSKVTMKYPSVLLVGNGSHGEITSLSFADKGQHLDSGAKLIHMAKNTSGVIKAKSVCQNGGRTTYRGLVKVTKGSVNSKIKVTCDALIMDSVSQTDTYPYNEIYESEVSLEHEAYVSKVSESQLFYLTSRGVTEEEASGIIVSGYVEPIVKELPLEYAAELNQLLKLSTKGSVG